MSPTSFLRVNRDVCTLLLLWGATNPGLAFTQAASQPTGMTERDHLRNRRYCEILVVSKHGFSATAAAYNTVGLNECPEAEWKALDPNKLKIENKAYSIVMNGPRYFTTDHNALKSPGPVRDFDGLHARLVAQVELSSASIGRQPYVENTVERESQYVYEAGKNCIRVTMPKRSHLHHAELPVRLLHQALRKGSQQSTRPA